MHLLGVDHLGRDLFTRVLYAGRVSLTIAIVVTLFAETIGVIIGAYAGFYGGWLDSIISRTIEFMLTIPQLPILLIISQITLKAGTYYGSLTVAFQGQEKVFDSRSSDSIALAIHFHAPIVVGRDMLDKVGTTSLEPKQETL